MRGLVSRSFINFLLGDIFERNISLDPHDNLDFNSGDEEYDHKQDDIAEEYSSGSDDFKSGDESEYNSEHDE